MNQKDIDTFKTITDKEPLSWQKRLYDDWFATNKLPSLIDLPTGMGKTMVMAIWLIARSVNPAMPRRLVYVVDRRTVVDQATDLADQLHKNFGRSGLSGRAPAISTLRGQLADNREWSRDPSLPAIIIGTVDLIGSALLFSGYRSSFKERPLQAGLLGQDSLLVLDEAHLSKPFEKLIKSISCFQKGQGKPMEVIRMSATTAGVEADRFKLEDSDLGDTIVKDRYQSKKRLTIEPPVEKNRLNDEIAKAAMELANDDSLAGRRIVVFVRSPDDATEIAELIRRPKKTKKAERPFADAVEVLTGTMRGLERDELLEKPILKRFLDGDEVPAQGTPPIFLIATSAGEVGFDLNADHLICDDAPLDSQIQRLGRVNRRGNGLAIIRVFVAIPPEKKTKKAEKTKKADADAGKHTPDSASAKAIEALRALPKLDPLESDRRPGPIYDASPRAFSQLAKSADALWPEPTMVELTDILLDAWSMTSITTPMPGRPRVAPWLRGIDDDSPQTTIAWRAELDLFKDHPYPYKAFKAMFLKHRVRSHESLAVNSNRVVEFLKAATAQKGGRTELRETRLVVKFSQDIILRTVGELIDDPGPLNADPILILPASFGGLDAAGTLSAESISHPRNSEDQPLLSLDVADKDGYEARENAHTRLRILIEQTEDGWKPLPLPRGTPIPADLNLEDTYDKSKRLFDVLTSGDLRVRLVQPVVFDEEGNPVQSLIMLSPVGNTNKYREQSLAEHVGAVEAAADRIVKELDLKDPFRSALVFAAKWHDEGKRAGIWQKFIGGTDPHNPLGKSATSRDPKVLRHYRHEFGSLVRILQPVRQASDCTLPADADTADLALHLIATHHGFSRPHFTHPFDRDFKTEQCETTHVESVRRFARLQREYGWWHLARLENLLRCADALASADNESEDDPSDPNEDDE